MKTHNLIESVGDDNEFYDNLVDSIKFDLVDFEKLSDISNISSELYGRPPYPLSLFSFKDGNTVNFVLSIQDKDSIIFQHFAMIGKHAFTSKYKVSAGVGGNRISIKLNGIDITEKTLNNLSKVVKNKNYFNELDDIDSSACMIADHCDKLARIFNVISCSNVIMIDNQPPKFINKIRNKKGKLPIFSYKTLNLDLGETTANKNKGDGSHASPRVHLRRGHIRKLKNGSSIWVQPCVVGDKAKGMVHKDYEVRV